MRHLLPSFCAASLFFSLWTANVLAQGETAGSPLIVKNKESQIQEPIKVKFEPFTGKLTKGKVRLRVNPTFEAPVVRELSKGELVVINGESEDFFAIEPPSDLKGYVFRTYILDNIVEGEKVNIRLKPDKESTIIGQLKSGDRVSGVVAAQNNKWLEITLPKEVKLFVSKDYIEKVGDASFKERFEKKEKAARDLLNTTNEMSEAELHKPFEQMCFTGIWANYQHIINDYAEFPDIVAKAKDQLSVTQKAYTEKKIAYLEEQNRFSNSAIETSKQLASELAAHKNKILELEHQIEQNRYLTPTAQTEEGATLYQKKISGLPQHMSMWIPKEEALFHRWMEETAGLSPQEFYSAESAKGFVIKGIVDPYTRPVKNKPGDFLLLSSGNKLPIAFLYSTTVNLQDLVGHEVTLFVIPRDNNHFAFPAYFVLKVE